MYLLCAVNKQLCLDWKLLYLWLHRTSSLSVVWAEQPIGQFEQNIYFCNQNKGAVTTLRHLVTSVTDNVTPSEKHKVDYILIH